ncbi:MAG TPA: hypothetical protein VHO70_12700 [Chitinispirillaceae bacterium]|nr:hypothetical protein [Chitinispirillaceae bacterium]
MVIVDKTEVEVFGMDLVEADLNEGNHEFVWAEYFDGEKFNVVPIPGILRE